MCRINRHKTEPVSRQSSLYMHGFIKCINIRVWIVQHSHRFVGNAAPYPSYIAQFRYRQLACIYMTQGMPSVYADCKLGWVVLHSPLTQTVWGFLNQTEINFTVKNQCICLGLIYHYISLWWGNRGIIVKCKFLNRRIIVIYEPTI